MSKSIELQSLYVDRAERRLKSATATLKGFIAVTDDKQLEKALIENKEMINDNMDKENVSIIVKDICVPCDYFYGSDGYKAVNTYVASKSNLQYQKYKLSQMYETIGDLEKAIELLK